MYWKGKIIIALVASIGTILVLVAFGIIFFGEGTPDNIAQEPSNLVIKAATNSVENPPNNPAQEAAHKEYLKNLLTEYKLNFSPVLKNDFAYYELHSADEQLAGFVLLGKENGWGGPINLFVKTNAEGIIRLVHVWQHSETPIYVAGLDAFLATFAGHKAEAKLTWKEDVHGITGATVTANAIISAVYGTGTTAYQKGLFIQRE